MSANSGRDESAALVASARRSVAESRLVLAHASRSGAIAGKGSAEAGEDYPILDRVA